MIRVTWALRAADAPPFLEIAQTLAAAEVAAVDWHADDADAALESARILRQADLLTACLAARLALPNRVGPDSAWLDPARAWVMAATELEVPQLRLRLNRSADARYRPSPTRLADQLAALADLAGQQGVRLMLETRGELAHPAELWRVLELSGSPQLGACLTLDDAPNGPNAISVLNLRIRYVHVHATARAWPMLGATVTPMVSHLRGIGYAGDVAIACEPQLLIQRVEALRRIIQPAKNKSTPTAAQRK